MIDEVASVDEGEDGTQRQARRRRKHNSTSLRGGSVEDGPLAGHERNARSGALARTAGEEHEAVRSPGGRRRHRGSHQDSDPVAAEKAGNGRRGTAAMEEEVEEEKWGANLHEPTGVGLTSKDGSGAKTNECSSQLRDGPADTPDRDRKFFASFI